MVTISIRPEEVERAKQDIKTFDKHKTYNKFECNNNWIGLVGEIVLDRYLTERGIKHKHLMFNKKGWNEPDFIIDGKTVDLKTTTTDSLWFQQPKFDVYVLAIIDVLNSSLTLEGYATKLDMEVALECGMVSIIKRGTRVDHKMDSMYLRPINLGGVKWKL